MSAVLSIYLSLSRVPCFLLVVVPGLISLGSALGSPDAPFLSRCPSTSFQALPPAVSDIRPRPFSLESMRQITELMTLPWNQEFTFHKRWDFYIRTLTHRECSHMWTFSSTSKSNKAWFESKMGWEKRLYFKHLEKKVLPLAFNHAGVRGTNLPCCSNHCNL